MKLDWEMVVSTKTRVGGLWVKALITVEEDGSYVWNAYCGQRLQSSLKGGATATLTDAVSAAEIAVREIAAMIETELEVNA
ncbi:hypothetical protein [uncultured Roseibium sp.]|uniref:hypothetical protein n=1 Tax=uncultured Roseibium sp. TaxID=1936171 RepID=UPI00260720EC|nr:hypothetical protein [uncultured Roseibium sp.]